jgi:hypothetical protein
MNAGGYVTRKSFFGAARFNKEMFYESVNDGTVLAEVRKQVATIAESYFRTIQCVKTEHGFTVRSKKDSETEWQTVEVFSRHFLDNPNAKIQFLTKLIFDELQTENAKLHRLNMALTSTIGW